MAMIIKEISAAVDEKNNVPVIVAKQKDFKSRFINVRLINSGGFMKIQKNANVIANFKRGDGEAKSFAGGVNEDGTVKILLPFWVLELSDTAVCDTTAEWRVPKINVFGKTNQVTTVGKNLIPENGSWGFQPAVFSSSFSDGVWTLSNKMPFGPKKGILNLTFPEDGQYTISLQNLNPNVKISLEKTFQQKTSEITYISNSEKIKTFVISDSKNAEFCLKTEVPERTNVVITQLQLEKGTISSYYEPYSKGYPSPSIEYPQPLIAMNITKITVEGAEDQKQVTFSKPISLHGIQSDKGNVVIDGVKYLSDVLGTDNITRHIRYINSYNGEEIGDQWKSSTGQLSTGAEVIYCLSDPVSEPFQEEDMQALKTLKTFYPTSTISAVTNKGESAWIQAEIINDPINYINRELINTKE